MYKTFSYGILDPIKFLEENKKKYAETTLTFNNGDEWLFRLFYTPKKQHLKLFFAERQSDGSPGKYVKISRTKPEDVEMFDEITSLIEKELAIQLRRNKNLTK